MKQVFGFLIDTRFNSDKKMVHRETLVCATRELAERALEAIRDRNARAGYTDRTISYGEIRPSLDVYETLEEIPILHNRKEGGV